MPSSGRRARARPPTAAAGRAGERVTPPPLAAHCADDAFQETILRALRAYDRLAHGDNLRAWLLAIARNVALDELRRSRPTDLDALPEPAARTEEPAGYEQLAELAGQLPARERAAV